MCRVKEYGSLPREGSASEVAVGGDWPPSGAIEFKDVVVRYRPYKGIENDEPTWKLVPKVSSPKFGTPMDFD